MSDQRKPPARAQNGSCSILYALSDDTLTGVLRASQAAKVLGRLASTSKYLCRTARSRVPVCLRVSTQEDATHILASQAAGRPPFSGCVDLLLAPEDMATCLLAVDIVGAAQQWPALQSMALVVHPDVDQVLDGLPMDFCIAPVLSGLPALQQLRSLKLNVAAIGPSSARHIGRMCHLVSLELTASGSAEDVPLDLSPLSAMTSLLELVVHGGPAVRAAAGPEGPFCLPSSLRSRGLDPDQKEQPAPLALWLSHLRGCPQLQSLHLVYHEEQHSSTHPAALVPLLAQHNRQLRRLVLDYGGRPLEVEWDLEVAGLPEAALPGTIHVPWSPDPALAALPGLEHLSVDGQMYINSEAKWQALVQLPALQSLAGAVISWAPPLQQSGAALRVLVLDRCDAHMGGYDLGRLLLACPLLQHAAFSLGMRPPVAPVGMALQPQQRARLTPHPSLQHVMLYNCGAWGAAAGAEFGDLAAAVAGMPSIGLQGWPLGGPGSPHGGLPDLSPFTALIGLLFMCSPSDDAPLLLPEQEDFLGMVAAAPQLQHIVIHSAPRVNARCALLLQTVLPRLQVVELVDCGSLMPLAAGAQQHTCNVHEVLAKVRLLLRPGIVLNVSGQVW